MGPTPDIRWVATLSDGATVAEHEGPFTQVPGGPTPWRHLCETVGADGRRLTSLRLQAGRHTLHLPRRTGRFGGRAPERYSLCYRRVDAFGVDGQGRLQAEGRPAEIHVDAAAHFGGFSVHVLVDRNHTAWIEVLPDEAACAAPAEGAA